MPANQRPTIQTQQPKTPKQITHNHKKIPWTIELEREYYIGSNNWADRFSIEEQIGILNSTNMVKKFKTQTKQNPSSHTKTEIYRVIPLWYERSS